MTEGRAVVVTAAAAGIGLSIVKAFAANGDRVHICGLNAEALVQTADQSSALTTSLCDISQMAAVEEFIGTAVNTLGGIDILVNNAGISGPTAPVEDMDPAQREAVASPSPVGTRSMSARNPP